MSVWTFSPTGLQASCGKGHVLHAFCDPKAPNAGLGTQRVLVNDTSDENR